MKSIIKKVTQGLLLLPVMVLGLSVALGPVGVVSVSAQGINEGVDSARGDDQPLELFGENGDGVFRTVTNILLFVIGAVAVIMLIIGGIRYVVSGGDQSAVTGAKNTILYAIVGIVVAILAYAAVSFVTERLAVQ